MKTAFFTDPSFLAHDTGNHPENAGRLMAITEKIKQEKLDQRLISKSSRRATESEISLVHPIQYQRLVEDSALSGQDFLNSPDCILSPHTYNTALNASGAAIEAVLMVSEGKTDNAFVACRPPGHHAETNSAMGFCFFNNIAIAASYLTNQLGYNRVLIFDFDVHHGNGTQHTFEDRNDVFFASIHQHPSTCYPGTGFSEERGRGDGIGYTLNVPVTPGATDNDYIQSFDNILLPAFYDYKPDFILISAGFDAHMDDPLASVDLSVKGFDHMISGMTRLAKDLTEGRLVSILEGGYNYQRLAECVASHLKHLLSEPEFPGQAI